MSDEIILVRNGQATLSDAVVYVANLFNPLGAAGPIIAALGGCVAEIRRFRLQAQQFRLEERRYRAAQELATDAVRSRQAVIIRLFEERYRDSTALNISLVELRRGFRKMVDRAGLPGVSALHGEIVHGTVGLLAEQLYRGDTDASGQLILLSDSLQVADTRAAITAWRALEGR
jgi:hypothetical protein